VTLVEAFVQTGKQPRPLDQVRAWPRHEEFGCQEQSSGVPGDVARRPAGPGSTILAMGTASAMRAASAAAASTKCSGVRSATVPKYFLYWRPASRTVGHPIGAAALPALFARGEVPRWRTK
jgi:hypothetical protein